MAALSKKLQAQSSLFFTNHNNFYRFIDTENLSSRQI